MIPDKDFDIEKETKEIKRILAVDLLPLFNYLDIEIPSFEKEKLDMAIQVFLADLSFITFEVSDDDITRCVLDHLVTNFHIPVEVIEKVTEIKSDEINYFLDEHDLDIHKKYRLSCFVYRIANLITPFINKEVF